MIRLNFIFAALLLSGCSSTPPKSFSLPDSSNPKYLSPDCVKTREIAEEFGSMKGNKSAFVEGFKEGITLGQRKTRTPVTHKEIQTEIDKACF